MKEYIELLNKIHSLDQEITEIKYGYVERHEIEIENLWRKIEDPKKVRSAIFNRVIISIIVTGTLAVFTWIGEILYKSPSPDQEKAITQMSRELKDQRLNRSS
jgi:hypothetical protein